MSLKTPQSKVISMPLTDLPTKIHIGPQSGNKTLSKGIGHSVHDVILHAHEEAVFQVLLSPQEFKVGDTIKIEMLPEVKERGLLDTCVIDQVRSDYKVHFRAYNAKDHSVTIPKSSQIADVASLNVEVKGGFLSENCNFLEQYALAENVDSAKGVQATQTRQEIAQQIANDLKFEKAGHDLSEQKRLEIVKIFLNHCPALALSPEEVGTVKGVTVLIPTGDHPPMSQKCRPLNKLKEQISKWLQQAVISPCNGPWASPIVPVPKKDGRIRFAVDYRRLNAITMKDSWPVANLSEKLASLKSPGEPFKYFATLDSSEAYH